MTFLRRLTLTVLAAITLSLVTIAPASAYAPVDIVHTERIQAGPYGVTVGFSTWPLRAMKSLDFTFLPDGGIADKSGTLRVTGPAIKPGRRAGPLVRHPRKRDSWGLDVKAFDDPGAYRFAFVIDGPLGRGEGALDGVEVLDQPGPPLPLSWTIGTLPLLGLVIFLAVAWRRTRPGRRPLTV
ncbi:hypothetical protein ACLMAJ_28875 [Nocardia sp. KC 131]|uniref:hypothetical protein n=1 Tax=Nocardia arseniciresistens TaxID=3392119 RepID=UPI00398F6E7D